MSHIEPDDLATLALDGVPPATATRAHLDDCDACRAEYEALARTVALGRTGARQPALETPPSSVWAAIHGELSLAPELVADPLAADRSSPARRRRSRPSRRRPRLDSPEEPPTATITPLHQRRTRDWWPVATAAAAVGIVAGIAIGATATGGFGSRAGPGRSSPPPRSTPSPAGPRLARRRWRRLETACGRSSSTSMRRSHATDVREVWLIRSDASGLVSLGLFEGASGRFVVPDGIDLDEFTLVDVSAEPVDGDPAHSGDSIVRGELRRT